MKKIISLLVLLMFISGVNAQKNPLATDDFLVQKAWVDSTYQSLSLKEKIGQLFMVDIFSSKSKAETDRIKELIKNDHIGGVIFSKGGPQRQAKLTNEYQAISKIPLLIGMDAEWGLAMRLDSTYAFPWNMTLGAVEDNMLVERVGAQVARHCKRLGVHINFAPVADINVNPENPIIGNRSFGENRERVTQKSIAFMRGMHSENVLSSAKHFPGHGDTDTDSHKALPSLDFTRKRLDSIELYPFRKMIAEGVSSIMVGHLSVPALDSRVNYPSSISKPIITDLLKEKYQYEGLIFTDALNMRGIADYDEPGRVDLEAFLAGNDILLIPENVPKAVNIIEKAYQDSIITESRLAHSVKKILAAKYKVGLSQYKPIDTTYLVSELNSIQNELIYGEVMEKAVTLIKNNQGILPIRDIDTTKIAYVAFGDASGEAFHQQLNDYTQVDKVSAPHLNELLEKLKAYDQVIIGLHKSDENPWKGYKFTEQEQVWLHEIARQHQTILSIFTRPYALLDIRSFTNIDGIVIGYQNSEIAQQKTAQIIFGALPAKGKLPVSLGKSFPEGTQFTTNLLKRLAYGVPESVGMNTAKLHKIDSIAQLAVDKKMTPGLQMLVARKGKVIYQKSFGYHTYDQKLPVKNSDVYDLASLTKILATLPMIMELYDQGVIDMETKLSDILPETIASNKADITLKAMMSHYARLKPWIPFYIRTIDKNTNKASSAYFRNQQDELFSVPVAKNLYMRRDVQDSVYQEIIDSDLLRKQEYKYSDLGYYLLKKYLEHHYVESLAELTQEHFYKPLGATRTMYLPIKSLEASQIIPSEDDDYWREQKVLGYVHDQGAAMFGGVGGHAGLFSNSNGVAKIMQMYLNGGYYGGKRYFKQETIDAFNTCYYCEEDVRRGVGFDKPQLDEVGPTCGCISMTSFGHTGFTGTYAWADPEEEIVYIFLSNRTFPDAANRKLIYEDIRTKIQKLIYEAIEF